jgi:hypothetical protein
LKELILNSVEFDVVATPFFVDDLVTDFDGRFDFVGRALPKRGANRDNFASLRFVTGIVREIDTSGRLSLFLFWLD